MKKGYTKVLIIETVMIVLLLFNSFVLNILSHYLLVLFLFLSLCLFKIFFDFEKDKHRNTKDIMIYLSIYLLIVLIIYYTLGLITGYARTQNYYNIYGLINFILPTILTIVISEFLRYQLLRKSEGNSKLIILTTILFILVDSTNAIYYANFSSGYSIFVFIGLTLVPNISKSVFSTYTSLKTGYKPVMFFNICFGIYKYLMPIIPNFNEYLQSVFSLAILAIITFILSKLLTDTNEIETNSKISRRLDYLLYIFEIAVAIVLIYLVSGYFKYYAIAIASNSMYPTFEKGSVAIIKKIDASDYDKLEIGDIIAYDYDGRIIAHRIAKITKVDEDFYFYTKGDANDDIDNYPVREEMVRGTIDVYIPFIGYPTVLINELLND